MKIHLVYPSIPFGQKTWRRAWAISSRLTQKMGLPFISYVGERERVNTDQWPKGSPISITAHLYPQLKAMADVRLYDWREKVTISGGDDDILIGHPNLHDEDTVWCRSIKRGRFKKKYAFFPVNHGMSYFYYKFDPYIELVDSIFGIMGNYWYETWTSSCLAHWKKKLARIDMGIDVANFSHVKKSFNPIGHRRFFFIGNDGYPKGTFLLKRLFKKYGQKCTWVGSGKSSEFLKNIGIHKLDENFITKFSKENDFFITMGVADSNPTTILEAAAWGFPICATVTSGYYDNPYIHYLDDKKNEKNINLLNALQRLPERQLLEKCEKARKWVTSSHSWENVLSPIIRELCDVIKEI